MNAMSLLPRATRLRSDRSPSAIMALKRIVPGISQRGTIFFTRRTTKFTIAPFAPSRSPSDAITTCFTGVLALVLELASGIQGIDVDHDVAGAQDAEDAHGVLQTVRHHHRDPRPLCEPLSLKPRAEGPRETLEVSEADRPAHVGVGRAVAVFRGIALEQLPERAVLAVVDLRGNARRVVLEPDSVHISPPCTAPSAGRWVAGVRERASAPNQT